MMIAIVILGLGLVMTATMFPVAWTRARTLTEYTTQRSLASSAESTLSTLLHAAGPSIRVVEAPPGNFTQKLLLTAGNLAGDLFYDPTLAGGTYYSPTLNSYQVPAIVAYSDTRVHALNVQNILVSSTGGATVDPRIPERPWRQELMFNIENTNSHPLIKDPNILVFEDVNDWKNQFFINNSFYAAQVPIEQRVSPSLGAYPTEISPDGDKARANWRDKLSARRFLWAVLHRLRSPVGPPNPNGNALSSQQATEQLTLATEAVGTMRVFDFYIVTLRRTQPSNRYARQEWEPPTSLPDPTNRDVVVPASRSASDDVLFPTPWRVQIQLPLTLKLRSAPPGAVGAPTGVPTEVQVPPTGVPAASTAMLAGMFPTGTQFVDEVNGQAYRVVKRREGLPGTPVDGFAFLTLDREVLVEDVDDSPQFGGDFAMESDDAVRTVWVFPPAVDRSAGGSETQPFFDGSPPVVGIDVLTISLSPPG